jgi:hypothetical protein
MLDRLIEALDERIKALGEIERYKIRVARLHEASDERIKALGKIKRDKLRVARGYDKRVKEKLF